MKNRVLTFVLIFCFSSGAISQQYFFKNYNVGQGIISSEVFDVIQASNNTLWLATFKGLSNFDGKTFNNFTKEDGLCSNSIRTVFEDSRGRIWAGAWNEGLSYIENGVVTTPSSSVLTQYPNIIQFFETEDQVLWIFTTGAILNYRENKFELIYRSKGRKDYGYPNDVVQTKDGIIWVATLGGGIAKIKTNPFSIEMINENTHKINNICYSLYEDRKGVLWVGSYGVLYKYNNANDSFTSYEVSGGGSKNRVWSITEDRSNMLWLALYGNGMASFNKDSPSSGFNIINSKNGLTDDYNFKLIIDSENNKWLASQSNGLIKVKDFSFSYFTERDGLSDSEVNAIIMGEDSLITVATKKGIVSFSNGSFYNNIHPSQYINDIAYDNQNNLWCVTGEKYGLVSKPLEDNFKRDLFYNILITNNDVKYFIGERNILQIKNKTEKKYYFAGLQGRTASLIKDRVLIGTIGGIKEFYKDSLTKIELGSHDVKYIQSSISVSENEVLMGSSDYLIYLKLQDNTYSTKVFSSKKFHSIRGFNSLLLDGNNLWIGSDNALSKVDYNLLINKDTVAIDVYSNNLGFIKGESSPDAILKVNSEIYVGTKVGLVKFSPSMANISAIAPNLILQEVKLFSEKLDDSLFLKKGRITLPYDKNYLTFNFSAVSLTYPENIKYKYRLKGLRESEWSMPTKKSEVVYPYLPAGNYSFEFTADNGFGVWQENHQKYDFAITLPFWKTDVFKFGVTALFLWLGFLIIYYHQRKKKIEQKRLTAALLSSQERERKRVSKELHDGVGQKLLLIKNSLKLDSKKTPKLIDSTIEDIRTISRNLHPFQLEKFGLTKAIINLVEEVNEFSEIFFSEEIATIDAYFSEEREIYLYRIIQECISNIVKHSKATAAKITIKNEPKKVVITIQDNGIGFNFEKDKNNLKSLGLKSLVERVDFLKGKISFDSPPNKGVRVTVISYK